MDRFSPGVDAVAHLISSFAWPVAVFALAVKFGPTIQSLLANISKIGVKAGPIEASLEARENAVAALSAAEAVKTLQSSSDTVSTKSVVDTVREFTSEKYVQSARNAQLLWVDDKPPKTAYERKAFEAIGANIVFALDTDDALSKLSKRKFDVIISDMSRPPDEYAGYTLLSKLPDPHPPFIIFSTSGDPRDDKEARRRGAVGYTNSSSVLFEMVMTAMANRQAGDVIPN